MSEIEFYEEKAASAPKPERSNWQDAKVLSCTDLEQIMSKLLGKVLTLMDATVADARQNKALKDLTKSEFSVVVGHVRASAMPERSGEGTFKLNPTF